MGLMLARRPRGLPSHTLLAWEEGPTLRAPGTWLVGWSVGWLDAYGKSCRG